MILESEDEILAELANAAIGTAVGKYRKLMVKNKIIKRCNDDTNGWITSPYHSRGN